MAFYDGVRGGLTVSVMLGQIRKRGASVRAHLPLVSSRCVPHYHEYGVHGRRGDEARCATRTREGFESASLASSEHGLGAQCETELLRGNDSDLVERESETAACVALERRRLGGRTCVCF